MPTTLPVRKRESQSPWRPKFASFFGGSPLTSLRQEMDSLLNRFSVDWDGGEECFGRIPTLDISETEDEIRLELDVPGMKPEELSIEVTGDIVRISGERSEEREEKGRKYHRVERRSGAFERTVRMPCGVDEDHVNAEYHDGVLTVTLEKSEEARTRKIPVKG